MKNLFFIILILVNLLFGCGERQTEVNNSINNTYESTTSKEALGDISGYCSNVLFQALPSCLSKFKDCASSDIVISEDQNEIYSAFKHILEIIENEDQETVKNMVIENEDLLAQYINANFLKGVIDSELTMRVEKDNEINTNYILFLARKTETIVYVCPIKLISI